jgi:hypothetical protein
MLIGLAALALAVTAPEPQVQGDTPATAMPALSIGERVAGREQARISFTSQIRGWRYEREDGDDILYVEGTRNQWYRGELACFGLGSDIDFALGLIPLTHGGSFDRFSRVVFTDGLGHRRLNHRADCRLTSLVALTDAEAIELKLRRAPREAQAGQAPS